MANKNIKAHFLLVFLFEIFYTKKRIFMKNKYKKERRGDLKC